MPTKAETKRIIADGDWWRDWGKLFGWTLYGFSYRDSASFFVGDPSRSELHHVSRDVRASIDLAINSS